jgi:hypothetical protein
VAQSLGALAPGGRVQDHENFVTLVHASHSEKVP